ncbi:rhodanese-related sulfurtransferase [Halospina denitrificans]|uniref:Rhodanese-related sulfurtransferase n=1 Tax=Halospina denitrificans TaxID=332522 RepID=A0A4R7JKS3_9GAMM|nr:rhodanese-like domain-containing protein [Halospina denitrificans]TDT38602.1 rhodanese-related sulfurtransferase [Halospina denitrificans]
MKMEVRARHSGVFQAPQALSQAIVSLFFLLPAMGAAEDVCEAEAAWLEQMNAQSHTSRTINNDCFVRIDEVSPEERLIVDTRPSAAFRNVHIQGSLNLHEQELIHSKALKSRSLLVVDQGFHRTKPAQLCQQALDQGFEDIQILLGGLASWDSAGRELKGHSWAKDQLHTVEPRDLFAELYTQRVSLALTGKQSGFFESSGSGAVRINRFENNDELRKELPEALRRQSEDGRYPVVLVGEDPELEHLARQYRYLFVSTRGEEQLSNFYRNEKRMAENRDEVPERYQCSNS